MFKWKSLPWWCKEPSHKLQIWMAGSKMGAQKAGFPLRVLYLLQHSLCTLRSWWSNCVIDANMLPTNHETKHEPEWLMIILINPQNFMHGQYSSNLLILDRNLLKPVERMKRKNLVSIFTLVVIKFGRFDNSKSDLFANSNITLR